MIYYALNKVKYKNLISNVTFELISFSKLFLFPLPDPEKFDPPPP